MRAAPIRAALDCHSSAPTTPSPAGTVSSVTSGKNLVSRGARTIGSDDTGAAAGCPVETAGWKTRVAVTVAEASGLNSHTSVRKSDPPAPATRPEVISQPFAVAGEYAARADAAARMRADAAMSVRRMRTSWSSDAGDVSGFTG